MRHKIEGQISRQQNSTEQRKIPLRLPRGDAVDSLPLVVARGLLSGVLCLLSLVRFLKPKNDPPEPEPVPDPLLESPPRRWWGTVAVGFVVPAGVCGIRGGRLLVLVAEVLDTSRANTGAFRPPPLSCFSAIATGAACAGGCLDAIATFSAFASK